MEKDVDRILDEVRRELANQIKPTIRYDKNYHTITIDDFKFGDILSVKLIADQDDWLKLWESDVDNISFEEFKSFVSPRTKKIIKLQLKKYADDWPDLFQRDVFCCVQLAITESRKYPPRKKSRGGSPYGLGRQKINEIRTTAEHLYCFISYQRKKHPISPSEKIKELMSRYDLKESDLEPPTRATLKIIEQVFPKFKFETQKKSKEKGVDRFEMFYRKYIAYRGSLRNLKNLKRIQNGESRFIKKVLPDI